MNYIQAPSKLNKFVLEEFFKLTVCVHVRTHVHVSTHVYVSANVYVRVGV